jgi:hypothetical protein
VHPKNASWSFFQFGWQALLVASFFMLFEWFRKESSAVLDFRGKHPILQGLVYAFTMACIMHALLQPQTTEHIYFKF